MSELSGVKSDAIGVSIVVVGSWLFSDSCVLEDEGLDFPLTLVDLVMINEHSRARTEGQMKDSPRKGPV